jgi:Sulfotransferase family
LSPEAGGFARCVIKESILPSEINDLLKEIEQLRRDRSRWAARAIANSRALSKVRLARDRAAAELPPMPVIVGAPRSGTTLLRFMLDAHPLLAIPPETGFLMQSQYIQGEGDVARDALFGLITGFPEAGPTWDDFGLSKEELRLELELVEPFGVAHGIRAFYRLYARQQNKPRYGDKTPLYCEHIDAIRASLPEARFIHIIRDGRDTALSLRPLWFAPGKDITSLANQWQRLVRKARSTAGEDYLEIRYERLLTDTERVLREICSFIELPFDSAMLRYYEGAPERLKQHVTRVDAAGEVVVTHEQRVRQDKLLMEPPQRERIFRWKEEMTRAEQAEFEAAAGDLLQELGYEH